MAITSYNARMSLGRIQFMSLLTKGITTVLGIAQSLIVVRLLPPDQFGLVGLVMSIGGVIGVFQHLGIVDGAIREIATLKKARDIGKVIWVSTLVRQAVTIPLSILLFFFAETIAVSIYHRPEIVPYIRLFASILVLQGFQDVFGATLTGMKAFFSLYLVQIATAILNIAAFGYALWAYGTVGFFYAIIATTVVMVLAFLVIIIRSPHAQLQLPTWPDIKYFSRRVMQVGVFMYGSRIFFVLWQRLPLLMLGGVLASEQLGYMNIALAFGARLTIIAAALSEVNLSWMSSLFASKRHEFNAIVTHNMQRVFVLMATLTAVIIFFVPEILFVAGKNYAPAEVFIYVLTFAFFIYSLLDIGSNSVFVAANNAKSRMAIYGVMTILPAAIIGWLYSTTPSAFGACVAVLLGVSVAYISMVVLAKKKYDIALLNRSQAILLGLLALSALWLQGDPALVWRLPAFLILAGCMLYQAKRDNLIPTVLLIHPEQVAARRQQQTIICFAGAAYNQPSWTNRQHMMSRVAQHTPVLYIEPRIWIVRFLIRHWRKPQAIASLLRRLAGVEQVSPNLFIKSQWNLLPFSREVKGIAAINCWLNRASVLRAARKLGFVSSRTVLWLYDTESAEYLSALPGIFTLYDCVDDHAAQAGVDRNPRRVAEEEQAILSRANVVTVTSKKLLVIKREQHPNVHLVLNAGDVDSVLHTHNQPITAAVTARMQNISHPIIGSVGALDSYKLDFDLLSSVAAAQPTWQFVLIGEPVVDHDRGKLDQLRQLPNVHLVGAVDHTQVAQYVSFFDVCCIPYRSSRYNEASFPLKFWEFMVTGKPLVVTGLPELREYDQLISYVHTPAEFTTAIQSALRDPAQGKSERIALATTHTWQSRVDQIMALLPTH